MTSYFLSGTVRFWDSRLRIWDDRSLPFKLEARAGEPSLSNLNNFPDILGGKSGMSISA